MSGAKACSHCGSPEEATHSGWCPATAVWLPSTNSSVDVQHIDVVRSLLRGIVASDDDVARHVMFDAVLALAPGLRFEP